MEYRVKFHSEENDSYVELWQIVGKEKYIARHTHGLKHWCYVSDPLGYREPEYSIQKDVTVIVCDQSGKELFRTNNADDSVDFNTPKQEAFAQWKKYVEDMKPHVIVENQSAQFFVHWATGTPVGSFNQWLLSFMDPDLYEEAKDYAENWLWCMKERLGDFETLAEYSYLGERKKIERGHFRHKVCGVEWDEYYAGDYFIGYDFDNSKIGTMYSEAEARRILTEAIKSNFPDARCISMVRSYTPYGQGETYHKQERIRIENAWERIAAPNSSDGRGSKNLHRCFIDAEVAKEREQSRFFKGFAEIKKVYPNCIQDYNFL